MRNARRQRRYEKVERVVPPVTHAPGPHISDEALDNLHALPEDARARAFSVIETEGAWAGTLLAVDLENQGGGYIVMLHFEAGSFSIWMPGCPDPLG